MKKPLHFKYFQNDDSDESMEVVDSMTDSILGAQSNAIERKTVKRKYDNDDEGSDITPLQQVDYSKSKLDIN